MLWRVRQVYGFEYDAYDRLKKADYVDYADSGSKSTNNRFGSTYGYDVRGNISAITRNGQYWNGSCSPPRSLRREEDRMGSSSLGDD